MASGGAEPEGDVVSVSGRLVRAAGPVALLAAVLTAGITAVVGAWLAGDSQKDIANAQIEAEAAARKEERQSGAYSDFISILRREQALLVQLQIEVVEQDAPTQAEVTARIETVLDELEGAQARVLLFGSDAAKESMTSTRAAFDTAYRCVRRPGDCTAAMSAVDAEIARFLTAVRPDVLPG